MKPSDSTGTKKGENLTFRALYLMAIIFVVDGHTSLSDMFEMSGLFKYYSFQLMLFVFGSGYFFSRRGGILEDIARRAKHILVPLYLWNAVYGLGTAFLHRFGGFEIGQPLSLYTLLLAPLTAGDHFGWNLGAWFISPLFFVQIMYSLIDRAATLWKKNDYITFLFCLIPGVIASQLCYASRLDAMPLFLMRALVLLPAYAGGVLYRRHLERIDTLPSAPYLLIVIALRCLLVLRYNDLTYLLVNCGNFRCDAFGVYASAALAIAFYLRIARILSPAVGKSRLLLSVSRHTFDVMMHHQISFAIVNCVFLLLNMLGAGAADFRVSTFRTTHFYCYAPGNRPEWNMLYLLAGLVLPLVIVHIQNMLLSFFRRKLPRLHGNLPTQSHGG